MRYRQELENIEFVCNTEFYPIPKVESLKGFNHGSNICCFRKIRGSTEDNRMGQLKIGGRMNNSEISKKKKIQARKDESLKTGSTKNGNNIVAIGIEIRKNIKNVKNNYRDGSW